MIRKSLNKEHHEVCSCYPHAHWGSGHSHKASTMKEAEGEGVTEEGASDCSGDSITIDIVWQKKKKKVEKKNQNGNAGGSTNRGVLGSELAGTARVALQEAHNGWVTFGPSDELFQGELSISVSIHLAEDLFCPFLRS